MAGASVKSKVVLSLFTLVVPTLEVPHTATRARNATASYISIGSLRNSFRKQGALTLCRSGQIHH